MAWVGSSLNNKEIQELIEVFKEDRYSSNILVGGAIIDILEGRKPKDFDLIGGNAKTLIKYGFVLQHETSTASTFRKGNMVVQKLKTRIQDFDFKISQSEFDLIKKTLKIDEHSFLTKELIPVSFERKPAINSLRRIPHWEEKGYKMKKITYLSLLNSATKSNSKEEES